MQWTVVKIILCMIKMILLTGWASYAETDDVYPDIQMTVNEFEELFGNSDSEFEGSCNYLYSLLFMRLLASGQLKTD